MDFLEALQPASQLPGIITSTYVLARIHQTGQDCQVNEPLRFPEAYCSSSAPVLR